MDRKYGNIFLCMDSYFFWFYFLEIKKFGVRGVEISLKIIGLFGLYRRTFSKVGKVKF